MRRVEVEIHNDLKSNPELKNENIYCLHRIFSSKNDDHTNALALYRALSLSIQTSERCGLSC